MNIISGFEIYHHLCKYSIAIACKKMDKGLILETFTNCTNLKKAQEHFHSLQYYTLQSTHKSSLENNVSIQNLNENLAFYVETFSFSKSSLHWNLGFHGLMVSSNTGVKREPGLNVLSKKSMSQHA